MNNEEINELVDNMSFEEKDCMYKKIIESKMFDELRREAASWLKLKHIPYRLLDSGEVPYTPLMRSFLYVFEFCRQRYVITDDLEFNIAGHYFDNDKFLFLLRNNFGIIVDHDAAWTLESMKELMLRIEAETKPEYREMLAIEMENYDRMRQELLELFIFCNHQKKLRYDSNPAFTDIDFYELNQHLYNDYHICLSMADRRTLNTVGDTIDHIIFRLKDGNGNF
jgi:hypothetical protein